MRDLPRCRRGGAVLGAVLALAACDRPLFLPVPTLQEPNDECAAVPAPGAVMVQKTPGGRLVTWEAPADVEDVLYSVKVSIDDGGFGDLAEDLATTDYLDRSQLDGDREVRYRISADVGGCESDAVDSDVVITAPLAPEYLALTRLEPGFAEVFWNNPNDMEHPAVAISLEMRTFDVEAYTAVVCEEGVGPPRCRFALDADQEVLVRAVSTRDGESARSTPIQFLSWPAAPQSVTAVETGPGQVAVSWDDPNEHEVQFTVSVPQLGETRPIPGGETSTTFGGLDIDREYRFVVAAVRGTYEARADDVVLQTGCREAAVPEVLRAEVGYLGPTPYVDVFLGKASSDDEFQPQGFFYDMERCLGGMAVCGAGAPWTRVGTATEVDLGFTGGQPEVRFRDALGIEPDVVYAYRARAYSPGTSCPGADLEQVGPVEVLGPPRTVDLSPLVWNTGDPGPGDDGIFVCWGNPNTHPSTSALYRRRLGEPFGEVATADGTGCARDVGPFMPDTAYEYALGFLNADSVLCTPDGGERDNPVFGHSQPVYSMPMPATAFTAATVDQGTITLTWSHPNQLVGSVELVMTPPEGDLVLPRRAPDTGSFQVGGLSADSEYTFQLTLLSQETEVPGPPAVTTGRTGTPPTVGWTGPPVLDGACLLDLPGSASPVGGESLVGFSVDVDPAGTLSSPTADAGGVGGTLEQAAIPGPFAVTWTVEQSDGIDASLSTSLRAMVSPSGDYTAAASAQAWAATIEGAYRQGAQPYPPSAETDYATTTCGGGCFGTRGQLSAGSASCAVAADQTLRCWGNGRTGGAPAYPSYGAQTVCDGVSCDLNGGAVAPLTSVIAVDSGFHTCAVLADGTVRCWGINFDRQLGDGTASPERFYPTPVCRAGTAPACGGMPLTGVVSVTVADGHTCAVDEAGQVWCWGRNDVGQVGAMGPEDTVPYPTRVCDVGETDCEAFPLTGAVGVAASSGATCALRASDVVCWGDGSPLPTAVDLAGAVGSFSGDAVGIAAASGTFCALWEGGEVLCWGDSSMGVLGDNDVTLVAGSPQAVCDPASPEPQTNPCSQPLVDAVALAGGGQSFCALREDRTVVCWGDSIGYKPRVLCEDGFGGAACVGAAAAEAAAVAIDQTQGCILELDGEVRCFSATGFGSWLGGGLLYEQDHAPGDGRLIPVCNVDTSAGVPCPDRFNTAAVRACGVVEVVEVAP